MPWPTPQQSQAAVSAPSVFLHKPRHDSPLAALGYHRTVPKLPLALEVTLPLAVMSPEVVRVATVVKTCGRRRGPRRKDGRDVAVVDPEREGAVT